MKNILEIISLNMRELIKIYLYFNLSYMIYFCLYFNLKVILFLDKSFFHKNMFFIISLNLLLVVCME